MLLHRRNVLAMGLAAGFATASERSFADQVPYVRQAELLAKVAGYDRNFARRAGDRARVLLSVKRGNDDSQRSATQLARALSDVDSIGGLPHDVFEESFVSAAALAETCRARKIAIIYLTPGFADDATAIADALSGADVLTAGADPDYVPKRTVLGFDLVSGKPKLLVHLTQARAQNVDFKAEILKLMKVYE